jgi:hypothetical protein
LDPSREKNEISFEIKSCAKKGGIVGFLEKAFFFLNID